MTGIGKYIAFENWVAIVFLIIFVMIVFLKQTQTFRFKSFIRLISSKDYLEDYNYLSKKITSIFNISFFLITCFSLAFLLRFCNDYFSFKGVKNFDNTFVNFGYIFLYLILIQGKVYLFSLLFKFKKIYNIIYQIKQNYLMVLGFWLLPLLLLNYYIFENKGYFLLVILGFVCIILTMRYVNLIVKIRSIILHKWYYFILYICAFEIVPIYLVKLFILK